KGYAESWGAAKIQVQNDPELNIRREKIDPLYAIEMIHDCGGLAFLAHPYLIEEIVTP
ncbi:MAG TPA: PHP domain-containing protein, partial [Firmicutes bacterium]|nr:PHP domain-containing protein [Bacillota bacterium]